MTPAKYPSFARPLILALFWAGLSTAFKIDLRSTRNHDPFRRASSAIACRIPTDTAFCPSPKGSKHLIFMSSDLNSDGDSDFDNISANENDGEKSGKKVTISFFSEVAFASEHASLPNKDSNKTLYDFFSLPNSPSLLLRGSKNNDVIEISNPDPKVLLAYQRQCQKVNAATPTPNDRVFEVTTSGVKFPGLQIMSVATIGGKIISTANENGNGHTLPAYEFVLIQDTTYATGSRFLVWLFNKVTGNASKKDDDKKEDSSGSQTTRSLNTIRAVALENGNVAFECNASLGVQIQFPSIVMKMIPDGKEKSEKIGSESLKKALEDDVPTALEGFLETYLQWLES